MDRPAPFDDDVAFSESLVETILGLYTEPGDIVVDPFVGFGTTVAVAERMGRVGYGIELLEQRAEYARSRVKHPERILTGDARSLRDIRLPACDFSLTSPPYMTRQDHPQDPLAAYQSLDGDYDRYLLELADIYRHLGAVIKPEGWVVINAANLRSSPVTFLAWDICRAIAEVMEFETEIPVCWDQGHPAIMQDYCLVFRNREP